MSTLWKGLTTAVKKKERVTVSSWWMWIFCRSLTMFHQTFDWDSCSACWSLDSCGTSVRRSWFDKGEIKDKRNKNMHWLHVWGNFLMFFFLINRSGKNVLCKNEQIWTTHSGQDDLQRHIERSSAGNCNKKTQNHQKSTSNCSTLISLRRQSSLLTNYLPPDQNIVLYKKGKDVIFLRDRGSLVVISESSCSLRF